MIQPRRSSILLIALSVGVAGALLFYYLPVFAIGLLFFVWTVVAIAEGLQHQVNDVQYQFNKQVSESFSAQAVVNRSAADTANKIITTQQGLVDLIKSEHDDNLSKPSSRLN